MKFSKVIVRDNILELEKRYDMDYAIDSILSQYHIDATLLFKESNNNIELNWSKFVDFFSVIIGGFNKYIRVDLNYSKLNNVIRVISENNDAMIVSVLDSLLNLRISIDDVTCHAYSENGKGCKYIFYYDLMPEVVIGYLLDSTGYCPSI